MARLTARVRDAADVEAVAIFDLPFGKTTGIEAFGREISIGKHNVHALVTDAAGQPVAGATVHIKPTAGLLSSKNGPVPTRNMRTKANGRTGEIAWFLDSATPGYVEFTSGGEVAIYKRESCMLTLHSEQISATEFDVWCEFDGRCAGLLITMTVEEGGTWADGSLVVQAMAGANGLTNRFRAILTGLATIRATAPGESDTLSLLGGIEPPEELPEEEPDIQFAIVASGSETLAGEHEVRCTVTDAVTGLPVQGVTVFATPSDGTLEGASVLLDSTDVNGQTPLATWIFDPAIGGTVEFETPDGTIATYAVAGTDPTDPVPPTPVSYVLDTPTASSFFVNTSNSINITVRLRDSGTLAVVPSIVLSIASGYPTPDGSAVGDTTDGSGLATIQFTADTTTGAHVVRVEAPTGDFIDIPITVSVPVAGDSPHYSHMRVAVTDYFTHYPALHPNVSSSDLYDWLAAHVDHVNGGDVNEYASRNQNLHHFFYILLWALKPAQTSAVDNWLTQNGHTVEDAYLHTVGTSSTFANRIIATVFGTQRYVMNPGDDGFQAWAAWRVQTACAINASGNRFDSVFIDEFNDAKQVQQIPVNTLEYTGRSQFRTDWRSLFGTLRTLTPLGRLNLNCAAYFTKPEDQLNVIAAGGGQAEFANQPYGTGMVSRWNALDTLTAAGAVMDFASELDITRKGQTSVLNLTGINPGNYTTVTERCVFWEYASYLMVRNASDIELAYFNPFRDMNADPRPIFFAGLDFDVGAPTGARFNGGNNIWTRDYDNALILCRTRTSTQFDGGDGSAVTHALPAGTTWRLLNADGTQSGPKTSIQLRVSEAAVMVKS